MYAEKNSCKPILEAAPKGRNAYESIDCFKVPLPEQTVTLNLSELAEKYAQNVPFRFQVVNGFMAENTKDPTIGVDEVYSLHLVRELKVVIVKHDREEFEIPVNSAAKFGLIHNSKTSSYETVDNILNAKHLPRVVAVGRKYVDPDGVFSLRKNEVLLVKEAVKSKLGRKNALRVISVSSCRELIMRKDCDARFSTDPEATQVYLTDFFDNDIEFMPCSAHIYPGEGSSLAELRSSTISIERQETHRSVIISLFRDNPTAERKKNTNFIDIPTTIDIGVSVLKTENSDHIYRIYKLSEDLLADYNPSKIQACVDARTDDHYMTQAQLFAEMRKERAENEIADSAPKQYQKLLGKTGRKENGWTSNIPSETLTDRDQQCTQLKSNTLPPPSSMGKAGRKENGWTSNIPSETLTDRNQQCTQLKRNTLPPPSSMGKAGRKENGWTSNIPSETLTDQNQQCTQLKSNTLPPPSSKRSVDSSKKRKAPVAIPSKLCPASLPTHGSTEVKQTETALPTEKEETTVQETTTQTARPKVLFAKPVPKARKAIQRSTSDPHRMQQFVSLKTQDAQDGAIGFNGVKLHEHAGAPYHYDVPPYAGAPRHYDVPPNAGAPYHYDVPPNAYHYDVPKVSAEHSHRSSLPNGTGESNVDVRHFEPSPGEIAPAEESSVAEVSQPPSSSVVIIETMSEQLCAVKATLSIIMEQIREIRNRQSALEQEVRGMKKSEHLDESTATITSDMSPADVQKVLIAAGLSRYQESFSREAVDGEMFMMLDDEILCEELGVNSRLHRVRLLKMKGSMTFS